MKRKDAALAETAALLVLRKKLNAYWGGRRGQLTSLSDRQHYASLIDEAVVLGARKEKACEEIVLVQKALAHFRENRVKGRSLRSRNFK